MPYKPIVLVILDGWGLSESKKGNILANTELPIIEKLDKFYPHVALQASGISVGLPWGEPGNSEVGHMTIGTGQIIYQNMPRITLAIQDGEFFKNPVLLEAIRSAKNQNSSLHLMGLVSKGSVHSNLDHLFALLELVRDQKLERVFIHVFTDGRDSAPNSGINSIRELKKKMADYKIGQIATIGGRYFGMDRNNNWDRVEKAYAAMVSGVGKSITDPEKYMEESYQKGIFDEYLEPAVVTDRTKPIGLIKDNDSVIFFNFRGDRSRQITKAFILPGFNKFKRQELKNLFFVTMTQYEESLPLEIAFKPIEVKNCLGKILSQEKLSQLRIAETEKFAHVTYFFDGGNEESFPKEDRIIIPSKNVASFDQAPGMSAPEITEKAISLIGKDKYDFILINYANADIIGHTGNEKAATVAVKTIDTCLDNLIKKVLLKNGCLLITSDHGNVEEMLNRNTMEVDTEHSTNPVPLWFITNDNHRENKIINQSTKVEGLLSDIAPTILDIAQIKKSPEMTGESLLLMLK